MACALPGTFLLLRRMSMMGDALSHAVLPGLVLAFLFSGSTGIVPLFLGAAAVGLLTTFLTQTLHQYARVPSDASMGSATHAAKQAATAASKALPPSSRIWRAACAVALWPAATASRRFVDWFDGIAESLS